MFKTSITRSVAFAVPIAVMALTGQVHAQEPDPMAVMANMRQQLANNGGRVQAAIKLCGGDYSGEQLKESRQGQWEALSNSMSKAAFDKAFASGESEVMEEWKAMSKAEQETACAELKALGQKAEAAAAALKQ